MILWKEQRPFRQTDYYINRIYRRSICSPPEKRLKFYSEFSWEFPNVEVDFFEGPTVDYCFEKNAQYIIRRD